MINFLLTIYSLIDNSYFLLFTTSLGFCFKVGILLFLTLRHVTTKDESKKPWVTLFMVTVSGSLVDLAWICKLTHMLFVPFIPYKYILFFIRIAWSFNTIQYLFLGLFIEQLSNKKHYFSLHQKVFFAFSSIFVLFFGALAITNFNCQSTDLRPSIEFSMRNLSAICALLTLLLSSLVTIRNIQNLSLPHILKKQLKILIKFLIAPIWLSDFFQLFPLVLAPTWITNSFASASIYPLLTNYAMYHCIRRVMELRFLNLKGSVQTVSRFNFIDGFKDILEQLSQATTIHELRHITQNCFKEAFSIPIGRTHLYIRQQNNGTYSIRQEPLTVIESTIESFIGNCDTAITEYIKKTKMLAFDELAFSNFYEPHTERTAALNFLEKINADIFIPIYEKDTLIAYIMIDRFSRPHEFFSSVEQDEMLVFSSYLGNIINLIQNRNLETLIHREKELQEELYSKHQEINQYKESIRSFLSNKAQKDIGILFFKNRRFVFGNQAAKELITININQQQGHPISKELHLITRHVQEYKTPQSRIVKDPKGKKLVLSGMPGIDTNNVIITIYYPGVSDLIKQQVDTLKDPTKWDYLLYLETTKSGKLINELIPGTGETILQSKITLLKAALSKKALLLEMAPDDLLPTVEIIHHISLRETLHVLKIQGPAKNYDMAIKLFGINPIFEVEKKEKPLLEKLDGTGTLYIQNIHHLNLEAQEYLAEYIKYGSWRVFKSEQRVSSKVRIICSTNQNLSSLVQEGLFSKELYEELKKNAINMPSLLTLAQDELTELAHGYTEQAIASNDFKSLLELTDQEKMRIASQRPISFHGLKAKVQHIITQKSKKNHLQNKVTFDNSYSIGDPEIVQAVRLGKHALRDPKIMSMLWSKFKSQSKIASLLGVNRSSVNRRCKDYSLE